MRIFSALRFSFFRILYLVFCRKKSAGGLVLLCPIMCLSSDDSIAMLSTIYTTSYIAEDLLWIKLVNLSDNFDISSASLSLTIFACICVVLKLRWPSIFDTDSIGTPFVKVTVITKMCRAKRIASDFNRFYRIAKCVTRRIWLDSHLKTRQLLTYWKRKENRKFCSLSRESAGARPAKPKRGYLIAEP